MVVRIEHCVQAADVRIEHLLAPSWLMRLEYRYADFGQINPTFFTYNLGAGGDDRIFAHLRIRTHTVNLGLAYKF